MLSTHGQRDARRRAFFRALFAAAILATFLAGSPFDDSGKSKAGLTVRFRTTEAGGKYAPKNVVAVWVANSEGRCVRTLAVWAEKRWKDLRLWREAAGVDDLDDVDAVSGATRKKHKDSLAATWDFRDEEGRPVESGEYALHLLVTDGKKGKEFHHAVLPLRKEGRSALVEPESRDGFEEVVIEVRD